MAITPLKQHSERPEVAEFLGSMPAAYSLAFSAEEIREHEQIVARRRGRPVHVERWRARPDVTTVICVVAEDRAGLLALICRALVELRLEVVSAQVFSRQTASGNDEAVDFFWIRARDGQAARSATPKELTELERRIGELLAARVPDAAPAGSRPAPAQLDPIPAPRVFFDSSYLPNKWVLVVESRDFPGLLLTITHALHRLGVEILASDVTTQGWLARDRFLLGAPDGAARGAERALTIKTEVLKAVRAGLVRHRS